MQTKANNTTEKFDDVCSFIIQLGKAAHAYGSPAIRLEAYLKRLAAAFGLEGEFHSAPTNMIFAFRQDEGIWQKINLFSVHGGLDLTKLLMLDDIVDDVVAGSLNIEDAELRLKDIDTASDPYGTVTQAFGYLALGMGIAGLFGGGWMDILFSGILSLVVFAMVSYSGRKGGWLNDLIPLSTAFVAGVLALVVKYFIPEVNYVLITLSAIIVLIPGYSVSLGVAETVNDHLVSGLTNLINGLVYLFKQFIGAWLAINMFLAVWPVSTVASTPADPAWMWAFVPALFIGLNITFQTAPRYFPWAFINAALGYAGVMIGSSLMGSNLGNLVGAAAVGVFANIWEWRTGKPGSIVLLPAITVLVSGSIGFRGLMASAQGQDGGGNEFMQMFLIAITLTAGLLIANTLIKPKKSL
jgi:uncharacterized membrane protein YjjP (DUF1212 family)